MKAIFKSFAIAVGISLIAFGWTTALNINNMPDWYYGFVGFSPIFIVLWATIYSVKSYT